MDTRVKNDRRELVAHDTHLIVGAEKDGKKAGDQRELVFKDRHQAVHGNHSEHVHGNVEYMVGHGDGPGGNVDIVIEKDKKELVEKNSHLHVKASAMTAVDGSQSVIVGKDRKEEVKGTVGLKVGKDLQQKVGGSHSLNVAGSQNVIVQKHALDAQQSIYLNAGTTLVLESLTQLSLKVGGSFIDISPTGVSIQGPMVMINSGGAAGSGDPPVTIDPQKPDAPADAKQAKPTRPDVADDAVTGQTSVSS
jgi:type VI secretion system secreted protein VgrG